VDTPNKRIIGNHGMLSFQPHKANCSCAKRYAHSTDRSLTCVT